MRKSLALAIAVIFLASSPLEMVYANNASPKDVGININNFIADNSVYDNIKMIFNLSDRYSQKILMSTQELENGTIMALENISDYSVLLYYIQNIISSSIPYNITWGMSFNYSDQVYAVYIVISLDLNQTVESLTFGYSSGNNSIFGPIMNYRPNIRFSTKFWDTNWAGYEFYDTNKYYPINYVAAVLNVSNIELPPNPDNNVPQGMSAWIGLSTKEGGYGDFAQTGYSRMIYWTWDKFPPGYVYGNYELWYETNVGTVVSYAGSPPLKPGWNIALSIELNQNDSVTYGALIENTSQVFSATQYLGTNEAYWSQFIVEAFEYGNEIIQIAKFNPSVQFLDPFISGSNYTGGLNVLYNEGFFWDDLLNQTYGQNQNVMNQFVITSGWGQPEMTWENSNYDLQ